MRSSRPARCSCEGCEYPSLGPWLENVCSDLIMPEMHGCRNPPQRKHEPVLYSLQIFHDLMSKLEDADYRVYSSEINLLAQETGSCVEYGLKRASRCPENTS